MDATWVERRGACHPTAKFRELAKLVDDLVVRVQALPAPVRDHFDFVFSPGTNSFSVQRKKAEEHRLGINGATVTFQVTPEGILVGCPHHPDYPTEKFLAVPKWEMFDQCCGWHINNSSVHPDRYSLDQISELALGYLFFNDLRD